jgi:hypothetical protein
MSPRILDDPSKPSRQRPTPISKAYKLQAACQDIVSFIYSNGQSAFAGTLPVHPPEAARGQTTRPDQSKNQNGITKIIGWNA